MKLWIPGTRVKKPIAGFVFLALTRLAAAAVTTSVVEVLPTPNPVVQGQSTTLLAGVDYNGVVHATGTITLKDTASCQGSTFVTILGTITLGSATSITPGAGTLVVSSFPCAGQNFIVGSYSGDVNYSAGSSQPVAETVLAKFTPTTTTLISSLNPSAAGQNVTFTAQIKSTVTQNLYATGTITFIDINTSDVLAIVNVQSADIPFASFTTSWLPGGSYAVEAAYSGDNIFSPSTSSTVNQTVTGLRALPPSIGGVVSASQFGQLPAIAPGAWIEIYGTNLAGKTQAWALTDFQGVLAPKSLGGTSVTIGGQLAFLQYVSPGQVNAQVPSGVPIGSQTVVVTTAGGASEPYVVVVNQTEPGLFAPSSFSAFSTQYVAALYSDGATFVLPPGVFPGVPSQRAKPGDIITIYGVGFGNVIPNIPAGQIVELNNQLASALKVFFGGNAASLTYAGLAPQAVGLYQFNMVVPKVAASDVVPLTFTLDGVAGGQTLYIAVGP